MRIKGEQDFATGLMFVAIGAAALWIGADYADGHRAAARHRRAAAHPRLVPDRHGRAAWGSRPRSSRARASAGWAWRPAIMITLATVAFALLVDRVGLVITMAVSMTLAALGTPETRWREYLLFLLIMMAIGIGGVHQGLGMPIPLWPTGLQR